VVSADDPAGGAKLRDRINLTVPIFGDPSLRAIRAWGVEDTENEIARPATFVIDASGTVTYAHIGDDKRDRPGWDEVLDALRAASRAR
jgi:peroxiredoxin